MMTAVRVQTNSRFGNILNKWKQLDSVCTYTDTNSIVCKAQKNRNNCRKRGYPNDRNDDDDDSTRCGSSTTATTTDPKASSVFSCTGKQQQQQQQHQRKQCLLMGDFPTANKSTIRLFRSKRFHRAVSRIEQQQQQQQQQQQYEPELPHSKMRNASTSTCTVGTVDETEWDPSESSAEEDPHQLIEKKEEAVQNEMTRVQVSEEDFEQHYELGDEVGWLAQFARTCMHASLWECNCLFVDLTNVCTYVRTLFIVLFS